MSVTLHRRRGIVNIKRRVGTLCLASKSRLFLTAFDSCEQFTRVSMMYTA